MLLLLLFIIIIIIIVVVIIIIVIVFTAIAKIDTKTNWKVCYVFGKQSFIDQWSTMPFALKFLLTVAVSTLAVLAFIWNITCCDLIHTQN